MKIFLCADIHLGMKFAGYPDEVRNQLIEARFETLSRCIEIANEKECELFVIAGDLFDRISVAKRDIGRTARILTEFQGKVLAVLPGNHDYFTKRSDGLWANFMGFVENYPIIVLAEKRPYLLSEFDLNACLYPAPCDSKHSPENHIGWIKECKKDREVKFHIGIAHGSLEGVSPDFSGDYYPMKKAELLACGLDLWLMGHTHIPYQSKLTAKSEIFYPGTPEPDGFDCRHEGTAIVIDIDNNREIKAGFLKTGKFRFIYREEDISDLSTLRHIKDKYTDPSCKNILLKLKQKGAIPEDAFEDLNSIKYEIEENVCFLNFDTSEVTIRITPDLIEKEFTEDSFPYRLLKRLTDEGDLEALQIAYELIKEIRR